MGSFGMLLDVLGKWLSWLQCKRCPQPTVVQGMLRLIPIRQD